MKITRYLWINNISKHCLEEDIQQCFQSHGKIQTIRIHENNKARGAIVAFIDCKSSTKAFECVKYLQNVPLKLEYCEANGEPGITSLGTSSVVSGNIKEDDQSGSNKTSDSRSRSSSSSNTSSFGSSLDDCAKYPTILSTKRINNNNNSILNNDRDESDSKSPSIKPASELIIDKNDKDCLNKDYRGLLVENLSQRSSDTSLREGLFHEYKKHGKITSVAVMGQAGGRHAIISFKRTEDMEKAYEASHGKTFFGNQIQVKKHNGYNYIDPDLCPPEHAMDEYHPKATKTLFVGKLATGAVSESDLRKVFKKYGEIIDIDIKTQSNQPDTSFAFVQYYDISSVVRALRNQDSIKVDGKPVKLGFGKSQPANCLWVGNLQRNANDSFLRRHFKRFGAIMLVIPDPEYNCALVQFEGAEDALRAFTDTRERLNNGNANSRRMQVDYASNEYQMAFMNRLRKSCQFDSQDFLKNISDPYQTEKIQNLLISYTKYLGLLDETRTRSYDRYEPKSDYEDYDDCYSSRPSRQRKSVHQRLYNDSYGVEDEYSDDYHYSKPKSRHYDDYSSSRSPVRYSRATQKYVSEPYGSHDTRRSNYQHYSSEYYETKTEPSASTYYPYRRTPDGTYIHSNHNRSYSPSPTSSVDYLDDYPRYNLSPKRYSKSNKDYHLNRPRQLDVYTGHEPHFEQTSESRNWIKPSQRGLEDYTAFRSKSGSRSKISDSLSPHLRTSVTRLRSIKNEPTKKNHNRKINNNDDFAQKSSIIKVPQNTNNNNINNNNKTAANIVKTKVNNVNSAAIVPLADTLKSTSETVTIPSVVQPVDALSKLERERAKLLEELSLLSEDTSTATANTVNKAVKSSPKILDRESSKSKKKLLSPREVSDTVPASKVSSSCFVADKKSVKSENHIVKIEPKISEIKSNIKEVPEFVKESPVDIITSSSSESNHIVKSCKQPFTDAVTSHSSIDVLTSKPDFTVVELTKSSVTPLSLQTFDFSNTNQSRDPRLNSSSYLTRPLSTVSTISPLDINLVLPVISTTSISEPIITPLLTSRSYKDSTSDSDMDHISSTDIDVDKRIRELDAKMNRSEQSVRTLDYSKFRIRKKVNDGVSLNCVTTTTSLNSPPSSLMLSPLSSLVTSSSLLDVGYSTINRDTSSTTSDFIKTMLNQTKPKSYHLLSESGSDHLSSICSNYSVSSATCSSLSFRTVDLGANDIERRTLFSRFGSTTSSSLSFMDNKLNVDTSMLTPTVSSYMSKLPTTATIATTSSKVSLLLTVSPTTTISTVSAPNTPNCLESNQPMKSILKKSNNSLNKLNNKSLESSTTPKMKSLPDFVFSLECNNNQVINNRESHTKKSSTVNLKRKSDEPELKKHVKKPRTDNGPVLDDTLFQTYPTMPMKKVKKSIKKSLESPPDTKNLPCQKKSSMSSSSFNNSLPSEKHLSKKLESQSNKKISKTFTENKKSTSNKKSNLQSKSAVNLKQSQMRKGKSKSNKIEKTRNLTKRNKDTIFHDGGRHGSDEDEVEDEEENDNEDRFSENEEDDESGSTDNDNYESMYDKIKRRKSKAKRLNGENKKGNQFSKKRRSKHVSEFTEVSSDNLDSEDSEYWSVKSNKRLAHMKRKRPRMSDISSSHVSDSNSCKTNPCEKGLDTQLSSEYPEVKSNNINNNNNDINMKGNVDNIKDESITDESKAPAESFNLSSPHNSSQCSSPKYTKDVKISSTHKDVEISSNTTPQTVIHSVNPTTRSKSQHRPNDGPLKKRPITEPIMLSEDLPYLEKQPEEEYNVSSPTSINDEPPSQLESMYDIPVTQQPNVLEEVVLDDHHHSSDIMDVEYTVQESTISNVSEQVHELSLPADVDSASHILLTMKSHPTIELEYPASVTSNEPDQQLQSVAEHLISLAQIPAQNPVKVPCEPPISVEDEKHQQPLETVALRSTRVNSHMKQDDEVTIFVKNIIDRIKQETNVANTLNKEKLGCKRAKKVSTFNIPLSKPMPINNVNIDCRHLLPIDMDSSGRVASSTVTTTQQLASSTTTSTGFTISNQGSEFGSQYTQAPSSKSCQGEEKRSIHSDEANSTSSTDKRMRHNSAKSDCQHQSLDETIDSVVKGSMSSSASDVVSIKSVTDIDASIDEFKSLSNSHESINIIKGDLSSLEETMNEVINKMSGPSSSSSLTTHNQQNNDSDISKCNMNTAKHIINHDMNKQKKITLNQVKQPPVYQLTGNVGGIANLVLNIPSILTVNTLVSQQNALNHMVSFQNSVSGQNKLSNQLTLPLNKLSVSSLQASSTSSGPSQVMSSLSLTPANLNIQGIQQQQHNQNTSNLGVQSTEMIFTKLNSLTPIMIQAPLRNITSIGQNNNMPSNQSIIASRPLCNNIGTTFVSIAAGVPVCNMSTDTSSTGKLVNVSLTASINKPITTPINIVQQSPITTTHGLNLAKISTTSLDSNYYLMMQRQTSQSKSQQGINMCQSASGDVNVSGLSAGHSIILSQLTHTNSMLSPITPGYLTASLNNRSNSSSVPLQTLTTATGITAPPSILFRPLNIPFRTFEEKNDWLKQNAQLEFNYPIRWTGKLCLKNDEVFVQMHMLAGNEDLIRNSMNLISGTQDSSAQPPLRIVQRMRLETNQLEGLQRRLARQLEFCTCLTLAGGDKLDELARTSTALKDNFINYLQDKSAAGIINICVPDSQQNAYVIHIFPPCDFSDNQLRSCSGKLYEQLKEHSVPYLVIVITTV